MFAGQETPVHVLLTRSPHARYTTTLCSSRDQQDRLSRSLRLGQAVFQYTIPGNAGDNAFAARDTTSIRGTSRRSKLRAERRCHRENRECDRQDQSSNIIDERIDSISPYMRIHRYPLNLLQINAPGLRLNPSPDEMFRQTSCPFNKTIVLSCPLSNLACPLPGRLEAFTQCVRQSTVIRVDDPHVFIILQPRSRRAATLLDLPFQ